VSEPVSRFANDKSIRLWRQRTEPPVVRVNCGRGVKGCRRRVAQIYETADSAVVVFYRSMPDQPARFTGPLPEGWEPVTTYKRLDREEGIALRAGLVDDDGTVVCLEDDDYWSNVVDVGCRDHLGQVHLSRTFLMDALRRSRVSEKSIEMSLPRVS